MPENDKRKCVIGDCPRYGIWRTGICPICRAYLKRNEAKPLKWRLARRDQVTLWITRLDRLITKEAPAVRPLRRVRG